MSQALALGVTLAQVERLDTLRDSQQIRVNLKPEFFMECRVGGAAHHDGSGKKHPETRSVHPASHSHDVIAARFAFECGDRLKILSPLINHSDVTNIQTRIDAARNAAEENVADIESVDRQLRIHSSVDHADTAQQYNDRPFFECPGKKFHPIDGMAVDALQQASQY